MRFLNELPDKPRQGEILSKFFDWARANSIWVVAYGTGCGSIELLPLATSRFDMERFGIAMRPTPRQSDVIIISGYLAVKTLKRVIRTYEQMQTPKYVVALGSCTINGGMYWDSYNTIKRLDYYLPVDVYINGCMPRPEALIDGFVFLMDKIRKGDGKGWQDYLERIEWYKANQQQVIKKWDMPKYNW